MRKNARPIALLQEEVTMPGYKTVRRTAEANLPPIEIVQEQKDLTTGKITQHHQLQELIKDVEGKETVFSEAKLKVGHGHHCTYVFNVFHDYLILLS